MKNIILGTLFAALMGAGLYAQSPNQSALIRQLATCQSQSGQMMMTIADVSDGKLVDREALIKAIEQANPGSSIDQKTLKFTQKASE